MSPLLFLIFIEPLLRWQSGGRGYTYGCLSKSLRADHTTSASAYADDMLAAALSATDLARQAEKIEAWALLLTALHLLCPYRATSTTTASGKTCLPRGQAPTLLCRSGVPSLPSTNMWAIKSLPAQLQCTAQC